MPEYPETDREGVLHFINQKQMIQDLNEEQIKALTAKHMSNVCLAYALCMLLITIGSIWHCFSCKKWENEASEDAHAEHTQTRCRCICISSFMKMYWYQALPVCTSGYTAHMLSIQQGQTEEHQ